MEDFEQKTAEYNAGLWAQGSMDGLAGLLHEMQDGYSTAHSGAQVWHGFDQESWFSLLWHGIQDSAVWKPGGWQMIVTQGRQLIVDYNNSCNGCIHPNH